MKRNSNSHPKPRQPKRHKKSSTLTAENRTSGLDGSGGSVQERINKELKNSRARLGDLYAQHPERLEGLYVYCPMDPSVRSNNLRVDDDSEEETTKNITQNPKHQKGGQRKKSKASKTQGKDSVIDIERSRNEDGVPRHQVQGEGCGDGYGHNTADIGDRGQRHNRQENTEDEGDGDFEDDNDFEYNSDARCTSDTECGSDVENDSNTQYNSNTKGNGYDDEDDDDDAFYQNEMLDGKIPFSRKIPIADFRHRHPNWAVKQRQLMIDYLIENQRTGGSMDLNGASEMLTRFGLTRHRKKRCPAWIVSLVRCYIIKYWKSTGSELKKSKFYEVTGNKATRKAKYSPWARVHIQSQQFEGRIELMTNERLRDLGLEDVSKAAEEKVGKEAVDKALDYIRAQIVCTNEDAWRILKPAVNSLAPKIRSIRCIQGLRLYGTEVKLMNMVLGRLSEGIAQECQGRKVQRDGTLRKADDPDGAIIGEVSVVPGSALEMRWAEIVAEGSSSLLEDSTSDELEDPDTRSNVLTYRGNPKTSSSTQDSATRHDTSVGPESFVTPQETETSNAEAENFIDDQIHSLTKPFAETYDLNLPTQSGQVNSDLAKVAHEEYDDSGLIPIYR